MGLFDIFRSKENAPAISAPEKTDDPAGATSVLGEAGNTLGERTIDMKPPPEIPEHIFIEYSKPIQKESMESEDKPEVNDLDTLYRYLEQNLEKKGYEDALMNPDTSYMEEHIQFIQNELNLLIAKVHTYYGGYMRTIDFHIETRKRNGMVETVDELMTHKETVAERIRKVNEIEQSAKNGNGISQNLVLSYRKGYRNGFAAITYNTVLGKKG